MPPGTGSVAADAVRACRLAGVPELLGHPLPEPSAVTDVGDGVNDVYAVPLGDGAGLVVKFATLSTAAHLRAGVGAYRVLDRHTDLAVPTVHAFAEGPVDCPPFVVLDRLPGDPLADGFDDPRASDPDAVRLLGAVLRECARVPRGATVGYGMVESLDRSASGPRVVGEYDDFASWVVAYGTRFLDDPADHPALAAVAPRAADHLRAARDRLPASPDPALAVTDCSPGNLLAPDGRPPDDVGDLTGVVDLERAKVATVEFLAVNAEYLLTRAVEDPGPVRAALYDPLPFGPAVPNRDLYRLVALARSASGLPVWYDPESARFRERGDAVAAELERIVD